MDCALLHAQPLGEVVLHKLVVHHRKAHLIGKACRDILTERPHLSRHCDHGHGILHQFLAAPMRRHRLRSDKAVARSPHGRR
jgi:hypothetical protein